MGEMSVLSGMLYCADYGRKMYLCRCTTMKQKEYFNCSTYRKDKKKNCTSHQIKVDAVTAMIKNDLKFTIHFAMENKEQFLQILKQHSDAKTKRELLSATREMEEGQKRITALDRIIQSLYEDKVDGKISEERYLKMSDTYETEQQTLTARVAALKAEIDASKNQMSDITKFVALVNKYADFEELTPDILRAFIDKVLIYEKTKVDGHYRHTIEIIYNFVGAVDVPDFNEIDRQLLEF